MKSEILPIAGDASFRKFYRLISNKNSRIIVLAKKERYKNLVAYSTINKYLRDNKIFTPKLYTHNFSKGIIVIEDFGDLTFYKLLLKRKNKLKILVMDYTKLINTRICIYLRNLIYFLIGICPYF